MKASVIAPHHDGDGVFDPFDLRPLASLNRRRVTALPGIDPDWVGRTGGELCSKAALIEQIQQQAAILGLKGVPDEDLPYQLNELLIGVEDSAWHTAAAIATQHGRRLGGLLASLLSSPQGLSNPLSPWEAAYLRYWKDEVSTIVLGGGLASGQLGQDIAAGAQAQLAECGLADRALRAAFDPAYLPLIGAARRLPRGVGQSAALVDFGSTRAKRGLAFYDPTGALTDLRVMEPLVIEDLSEPGRALELADAITVCLIDTIRHSRQGMELAPVMTVSVAAYIHNNRPESGPGRASGAYALAAISEDIAGWFAMRIGEACGYDVQFQFVHDGDAAAGALAGLPHAAVIMMGTSLGVGFVPPVDGIRPVTGDFKVTAL